MKKLYLILLLAINTIFLASAMSIDWLELNQQLITAVKHKKIDLGLIKSLLKKGAYVDAKDQSGKTSLYWAAYEGHTDVIGLLIEKGASVNVANEYGQTPLYWAVYKGHTDAVALLIKLGASVNSTDSFGRTLLYWATLNGDIEGVKFFVEKGANVNAKNYHGYTPLYWAACHNHIDIIKFLIASGAEINSKDKDRSTPLHCAANKNHTRAIKIFIKTGANVKVKNRYDYTPLHKAAYGGKIEAVSLLVAAPMVFNTVKKIEDDEISFEQEKFFDVANKINYFSLVGKFADSFPQPAMESVAKHILLFDNFTEQKYVEQIAKQFYKHPEKSLSQVFFNELYKQHLFELKNYISIKNNGQKTAIDIAQDEYKYDIVTYLNEINDVKEYHTLEPELKNSIEENYKKRLTISQ